MFNHQIIKALGGDSTVELSSRELTKDEIIDILLSENSMLDLENMVSSYSEGEMCEIEDRVFQEIARENNLDECELDKLSNEISETIEFVSPINDYLDRRVCVNLIVDTGDFNFDFTLNSTRIPVCGGNIEPLSEESSILHLVKQQGYTDKELYGLSDKEEISDQEYNTFLGSVYSELENLNTDIAPLTFLVSMTFRELINLNNAIRDKTIKSVILDKTVNCGLYNYAQGSGSMLGIILDKDVEIQVEHIMWPVLIDGGHGYSVEETYGVYPTLWKEVLKFK